MNKQAPKTIDEYMERFPKDVQKLGIAAFRKELAPYKGAKGSVQFPLDEPLPLSLVTRIVKYRVKQNSGNT